MYWQRKGYSDSDVFGSRSGHILKWLVARGVLGFIVLFLLFEAYRRNKVSKKHINFESMAKTAFRSNFDLKKDFQLEMQTLRVAMLYGHALSPSYFLVKKFIGPI